MFACSNDIECITHNVVSKTVKQPNRMSSTVQEYYNTELYLYVTYYGDVCISYTVDPRLSE